MPIEAVIFDADGVLQRPTVRWGAAFRACFDLDEAALARFSHDILTVEATFLDRDGDVEAAIQTALAAGNYRFRVEEVLSVFNAIEINDDVLALIKFLRSSGQKCYLASNQQPNRAAHMSEKLHYSAVFEREFYSCFIGAAKPSRAFFETMCRSIGLPARSMLFVDDRPVNVEAAREIGLNAFVFDEVDGIAALLDSLSPYGLTLPAAF